MKPVWVIQNKERDNDASNPLRLAYAARELGGEVFYEKYVPFEGMTYDFVPPNRPVILHGSISMIKDAMKRFPHFFPLAWGDWPLLRCQSYYAHYGPHLLQQRYGFYPLAEVQRQGEWLFDTFGTRDALFIRPDENDKGFTGAVFTRDRLMLWSAEVLAAELPPDTLCIVARPEQLDAEYRVIVARGRAVTASRYREAGALELAPGAPPEVLAFAEQIFALWSPHPVMCVDVAQTPDGLRLVEIGSVNCAGFYQCDLRLLAEALANIALAQWEERETHPR